MKNRKRKIYRKSMKEPIRFGAVVEKRSTTEYLHGINLGGRLREYKLASKWAELMGPTLADKTSIEKLSGTALYIRVSSSTWMSEIRFHTEDILKKINGFLEEDEKGGNFRIKKLIVRPGKLRRFVEKKEERPSPLRRLYTDEKKLVDETVSVIKDPELRNIVRKAMASTLAAKDE